MNSGVLVGVALGGLIGFLVSRVRRNPRYLALAEYWVYLPGEQLPPQDQIMDRTLRGEGNGTEGKGPSVALGLLFSDIRFHIGVVLRSKNSTVFRPDLFADATEPTPLMLSALAQSKSFVNVRYASDQILPDSRHVNFVMRAAYACAELGSSSLVYDVSAARLMPAEQLRDLLRRDPEANLAEEQVSLIWRPQSEGGHLETRGLIKVGVAELRSDVVETDLRLLVTEVFRGIVEAAWTARKMPESLEVSAFEDRFMVRLQRGVRQPVAVSILRLSQL